MPELTLTTATSNAENEAARVMAYLRDNGYVA
jgi:hypothetical protein